MTYNELINTTDGKYHIELFKHKVVKKGTFRMITPYELTIQINMAYPGELPYYMTTYHSYFNTKREAMDVIKSLPVNINKYLKK